MSQWSRGIDVLRRSSGGIRDETSSSTDTSGRYGSLARRLTGDYEAGTIAIMAPTAPTHEGLHDPAGPGFDVPRYAVAGIRCALAARAPSIAWIGGDLGASFRAARPSRALLCVSAAHPYADLVAAAREPSSAWIAWSDIDSSQRLRRVRWALAEAGRRGRVVLDSSSVPAPGSWPVHARRAALQDARERLETARQRNPALEHRRISVSATSSGSALR